MIEYRQLKGKTRCVNHIFENFTRIETKNDFFKFIEIHTKKKVQKV